MVPQAEHWAAEARRAEAGQAELRQAVVMAHQQLASLTDHLHQLQVTKTLQRNAPPSNNGNSGILKNIGFFIIKKKLN